MSVRRAGRAGGAGQAASHAADRQRLGRDGERVAQRYLEDRGLVVLSRNWRCQDGELDLVATDGTMLIVCEVKTRSGGGYGSPAEAVSPAKVARVRRLTLRWLSTFRVGWVPVRFDVLSVVWPPDGRPAVTHLEGAF
ncbi:YraN family protein [Haloechinothrix sp. LS1_15]|uniref:YraN family protein n=1 Tax=Haloechinothrix sp. LS1_15 TaxID=2652248 RepID=UPI002948141B|nr:YraN family protein [Haloechinothrix sp. LS1_15]MDV6012802.1 YraN family protein [Haloechinothrix sp. LS1_15]